jgi:RHS repeat-associated protein
MQRAHFIKFKTHDRYLFQGQEMDDEVKGEGNSYTTEFRQLDSRLARWLSLDPIVKEHESPYACFANNPIWFKDPNGADTTLDEGTRAIIKDIIDATSANYNETFTKDFQRLVDDKTTVYSFKQWDKAEKSEGQVLYGVASGAGVDSEGRNLVAIEYTLQTSPSGHKLEAFFEEFDHGLQFLDQRIGYLVPDASTQKGRGPAFGYDYYDEVDNKLARVKYISAFKEGSSYKVQLFGINAKIVKSNFARTTVEKYVDMNYPFTDKEELNAFQALSKASDYAEQELRDAFNSGQRWAEFLIGAGK